MPEWFPGDGRGREVVDEEDEIGWWVRGSRAPVKFCELEGRYRDTWVLFYFEFANYLYALK